MRDEPILTGFACTFALLAYAGVRTALRRKVCRQRVSKTTLDEARSGSLAAFGSGSGGSPAADDEAVLPS